MTTDLHTRREATPDTDHPVVPDAEPDAETDAFEVLPSVQPGADPSETAPSNTVEVRADHEPVVVPRPRWAGGPLARWERPALATLLLATGVLLLWGLSASGWANSFYSAAVQAGSVSWKAFLFGSSDAANSITVDKPPASLWVMALSVRVFGLNSWSILVPQALMGVATVGAVWYGVRRWFSGGAALFAATVMALTPVAVLMFRFNNPDAMLTLIMTLAAIATLRGIEDGRRRWALATGALIGLGFLTKQLQVMLMVPPLALAWLIAGKGSIGRRAVDMLTAGVALVVSAGWWVALVELWPAGSRPWVGGSQNNSILELTLGYNGLGRITGNETGSVTGGGGAGGPGGGAGRNMWGQTGITRMIDGAIGGQIAWLLPAALIAVVAGLWLLRRAPRTDVQRASILVWGGWLVVTALTFSFMAGIFHEYYTVSLAPPIAALVGIGADQLWRARDRFAARLVAAGTVIVTGLWATALLNRAPDWNSWLGPVVLIGAVVAAAMLLVAWQGKSVLAVGASILAATAVLAAPAAWSLQTAATPHTGSIVTAGPAVAGGFGPGGGGPHGGFAGGPPPGAGTGTAGPGTAGTGTQGGFPTPQGGFPGPQGGFPGNPPAAPGGFGPGGATNGTTGTANTGNVPAPTTGTANGSASNGAATNGSGAAGAGNTQGGFAGGMPAGGPGGGPGGGGLLDAASPSDEVVSTLLEDADDYTWVAAAVGANNAAGYQLATEEPVMPLGGFNGSDPSPTLAEFQQDVADGNIHYFIEGGRIGPSNGGSSEASSISTWVSENFTPVDVDDTILYDLTQPV